MSYAPHAGNFSFSGAPGAEKVTGPTFLMGMAVAGNVSNQKKNNDNLLIKTDWQFYLNKLFFLKIRSISNNFSHAIQDYPIIYPNTDIKNIPCVSAWAVKGVELND